MAPSVLLELTARVLSSVAANTVQKRMLLGRVGLRTTWVWTYLLMLGPATLLACLRWAPLNVAFWFNAVLAGVLDALGNLAMIAALRSTELSIFGPLNAFRPILALLFAWIILGEVPSIAGIAGILVTIIGAAVLLQDESAAGGETRKTPGASHCGMLALRLAGLGLSTVAAVFLKRAASHGSAEATLASWTLAGLATMILCSARPETLGRLWPAFVGNRFSLVLHAALFLGMQWLTIRIFQMTLLAYSFAFFQLAIVLQMLVGWQLFREPIFRGRRIAGCAVMGLGTGLILWKG